MWHDEFVIGDRSNGMVFGCKKPWELWQGKGVDAVGVEEGRELGLIPEQCVNTKGEDRISVDSRTDRGFKHGE